jgi:uncharacterized protein YfiM (DUF2279 family)
MVIFLFPLTLHPQVKTMYAKRDSIQVTKKVDRDSWFGADKVKHMLGSLLVARYGSWTLYHHCNMDYKSSKTWAGLFSLSMGLSKEFLDWRKPEGHFSLKDLTADFLGIILGIFLISWQ